MNQADAEDREEEVELEFLFEQLFPNGILGDDVLIEIAPRLKWRHPILRSLFRSIIPLLPESWQPSTSLSLATEKSQIENAPGIEFPEEELRKIAPYVGACLYTVFDDDYRAITADGRAVRSSSGRGLSCFISERIAMTIREWPPDSVCFFMRDYQNSDTCDLQEIYLMIFRRLRAAGVDWRYSPTDAQEAAVDELKSRSGRELTQAEKDRKKEMEALCAEIDRLNRASRGIRWWGPDPSPSDAYRRIYGRDP
jgi:hypothetical protein